ncbi:MAG TPA: DUF3017 domain-containing protein [Marmoricola sp.]|nr:DUF3017 domain-containing protein [Marmoricola sp.]
MIPEEPPGRPRRVPSTVGGAVYLIVCAISVAGLLLVAFGPWRKGVAVIGAALVFAAGCRAFLSERDAGMLGVRSRWFDTSALLLVGAALITLANVIPDQPAV